MDPHFKRTAVLVRRRHLGICTLGEHKEAEIVEAHLQARKAEDQSARAPEAS